MANFSLESNSTSSSPEHPNAQHEKDEPQRCCVICARTSPKTIFSCRYKVHERNIEILQAFFDRPALRFGELCDRCYRLWYKHKRTKNPPANNGNATTPKKRANKEQPPLQDSNMSSDESTAPATTNHFTSLNHEAFHHKIESRKSPRNGIAKNKSKTQVVIAPLKIHIIPKADFTHCLKALSVIAKPPRKSRRKPTPVRSAPKHDALYEFLSTTSNKTQAAYLLFAALDMAESSKHHMLAQFEQQQLQDEPMDDEEEQEEDEDDDGAETEQQEDDDVATMDGSALLQDDAGSKEQEQASHMVTDSLLAAAQTQQDAVVA